MPCPAHHIRVIAAATLFVAATVSAHGHATHEARVARLVEQLAERPADPALHFQLAQVNCEHGDWQVALLNLETVDKLAPDAFPTALLRADAFMVGGKPARARAVLDPWMAAHPDQGGALLLSARIFARLGDEKSALAEYRRTLQHTPDADPDLMLEVADALNAHGDLAEAAEVVAHGIARLGPIPTLTLRALEMEIAGGDFDTALARIEKLRETAPRPEPWMTRRAEVLAQAGRIPEARAAWQALLDHLAALPAAERSSHAMCLCAERAHRSLASLAVSAPLNALTPAVR